MTEFALGSVRGEEGTEAVAIAREQVFALPGMPAMSDLLRDWDGWMALIATAIDDGSLGDGTELAATELVAPLPTPRNLYMAGANYADHAREMRKLPAYCGTPIIFLTTESDDAMKAQAKAAGATGWLVKPFVPDQLIRVARKVLGR